MKFTCLSDYPSALPAIAKWYFDEWGYLKPGSSAATIEKELEPYLSKAELPLAITAIDKGEIVGAAQLKFRELDIYPQYEHWLGGVFVVPNYRAKGVASALVKEIIKEAQKMQVEILYLQTQNMTGGLYRHLGWEPIEKVNNRGIDVLVMRNTLRE